MRAPSSNEKERRVKTRRSKCQKYHNLEIVDGGIPLGQAIIIVADF